MNAEPKLFTEPERPTPDAVIEFAFLPSINDVLACSRQMYGISNLIKRWKQIAEDKAVALARVNRIPTEDYLEWTGKDRKKPVAHSRLKTPLFTRPLAIEIHVWRPDDRVYDVHNVFHKPILDGFVAARLIKTDGVQQVKEVSMIFDGVDRALARSKDERERVREENAHRRARGRKVKRHPTRARFRFEFYTLPD